PLHGSDWDTPALGDFYFQAFDRSVSLPVAGYNFNSDWTPLLAGLSPAGMAASLASRSWRDELAVSNSGPQHFHSPTTCCTAIFSCFVIKSRLVHAANSPLLHCLVGAGDGFEIERRRLEVSEAEAQSGRGS